MSASCIYEGTIGHRRVKPRREFSYKLALAYLDLDELPTLLSGRLLARRPGLLRFRRRDYLGDPAVPLAQAVRDMVQERTGTRPLGPVRLLTQLRSFGVCFNPVSFYYCMDADEDRVQAVVAEVTNTPWGERHAYVLESATAGVPVIGGAFDKQLHVSPFMGMDHRYEARYTNPGERLSVHISSAREGETVFEATLALERRPLTRSSLAQMVGRYPLACVRVLGLIYYNALRLKLAGASVYPHPRAAGG